MFEFLYLILADVNLVKRKFSFLDADFENTVKIRIKEPKEQIYASGISICADS